MSKKPETKQAKFTPVVRRKLVIPQLKFESHKPAYFEVESAMYVGKPNPEKPDDKPADLAHVIDKTTGELCSIVVPAVLKSVWDEDYPDAAYVGKSFAVEKLEKQAGKRYFNYEIAEIE